MIGRSVKAYNNPTLHFSRDEHGEAAFVDTKLALSQSLRKRRTAQNISRTALAKRLKSSQARVAKMEAADATVSIDLLIPRQDGRANVGMEPDSS